MDGDKSRMADDGSRRQISEVTEMVRKTTSSTIVDGSGTRNQ